MRNDWKYIVLVIFLCVLFPTVLFAFLPGNDARNIKADDSIFQGTASKEEDLQISILHSDGSVAQCPLEEYLVCVLLCEMPVDFELDALKAQAVVARTYTLRRMVTGGKHNNAVVCTDPSCCQGYKDTDSFLESGGKNDALKRLKRAVYDTKKLVLTYGGELIEATYFSCSGGKTEDAKAVWGTDIPYLQATVSPGEERATHYTDTVTFSAEEFQRLIGHDLPENTEGWFGKVIYTNGGGVETILIGGKAYQGTALRSMLSLRSTAFAISAVGDTITVTTKGFGHRVGMSQYGAEAMAVSGSNFQQILAHYFHGTKLTLFDGEMIDKVAVLKYNIA